MKRLAACAAAIVGLGALLTAQPRTPAQRFEDAISIMETKGDYRRAIDLFQEIVKGSDRRLGARSLFYIGFCYEKIRKEDAQIAYRRLVREFQDQGEMVAQAQVRLAALGRAVAGALISRRIFDGVGVDFSDSSLSPDGRRLTFIDYETGDLALVDLSSGQKRHLTKNAAPYQPGLARFSVQSPDGKLAAYIWMEPDHDTELRVVGIDGSGSQLVYRNADVYPEPVEWSSDGARILALFHRKDNTNQMVLVNVRDGSARVVKSLDWRVPELMSLSPDGRFIVYDLPPREGSVERDIFLIAADGTHETTLVEHPANDKFPLWTPDGQQVIFLSDRTGTIGAWAVKVANGRAAGAPQLLRPDMGRSWPLRFGHQGSYYYAVATGLRDVYTAALDPETGRLLSAPTTVGGRLSGSNQWSDWSPDGRFLAYCSGTWSKGVGPTPLLLIQSLGDGTVHELTPPLAFLLRPRWNPDGRSILVTGADRRNRGGLYRIDVQSGELTPIVYSGEHGAFPRLAAWSRDGKSVFYMLVGHGLVLRDLETGNEQEISTEPVDFALSPDGRSLAITFDDQPARSAVLKIIPAAGGNGRELLREPGLGVFTLGMSWTADGRHLLFTKLSGNFQSRDLWRVPVAGGEAQKLGLSIHGLSDIHAHPDGRRIAFTAGTFTAELWQMDNLARGLAQK